MIICGFMDGQPVYRIEIDVVHFSRLVGLTDEKVPGLPDWLDLGQSTQASKRVIMTTNPIWFEQIGRLL